jgi:hypothetical protein
MKRPPASMRKGFDQSLAYALQTTRTMLFTDWEKTPPDVAERLLFHLDQYPVAGEKFIRIDSEEEKLIMQHLPLLYPPEMEWLLKQMAMVVLEKHDRRAPFFRRIADRYKAIEEAYPEAKESFRPFVLPPTPNHPRGREGSR